MICKLTLVLGDVGSRNGVGVAGVRACLMICFFYLFLGMMVIQNSFEIGELVYLKTDKEQNPRIIYCIKVYKSENIYELACGTTTSSHYEFELSKEVNVLMTTTN